MEPHKTFRFEAFKCSKMDVDGKIASRQLCGFVQSCKAVIVIFYHHCSRSCSWQLPRPDADIPRMGSDVGASRIWNRLLDAAFDNSDRRKHGMGYLGRMMTRRRRAKRRAPESSRKRKLGGNSGDHRPFFTYWMTTVQIFIMLISIAIYGIGPIGIDLYKKSGMVRYLIAFYNVVLQS